MDFARRNRAAISGSGAPFGYAYAAPVMGIDDPFIRGGNYAAILAKYGYSTCSSWNALTPKQKQVAAMSMGGGLDLVVALDNYCLANSVRESTASVYVTPIYATPYTPTATITPSGEVAAGFSFSLPELLVGGVLGFLAAKWLT